MTSSLTPAINHDMAELDESMTKRDLIHVLQHLPFRGGCSCTVKLDRQVRDYFLRALQQQQRSPC